MYIVLPKIKSCMFLVIYIYYFIDHCTVMIPPDFHVGRQHLKQVEFCQCVSDAATLVKLQLWPGSPAKPKVAFHFNLMDLAEKFLLESHVSLHKFCSSIETEYPDMLPKLVCTILYNNIIVYITVLQIWKHACIHFFAMS